MIEPIFLLHDRIERNHASCMAGQYEVRREYVAQIPNKIGRIAELKLLDTVNQHPEITAQVIGRHLTGSMSYAGGGSLNTVVHEGDMVTKINRRSAFMQESARHELRNTQSRQHAMLRRHLGSYILAQEFRVAVHPLNKNQRAVLSDQPLIVFSDLHLFAAHQAKINEHALELAKQDHPGIDAALHELAEGGKQLYEATGMLIDSSGLGNIVYAPQATETGLLCLDGLPIANPTKNDTQRIMGQLDLIIQHTT